MSNPYKAHKALLSGTTPYLNAWQTLKLPVFDIIVHSIQKYVNPFLNNRFIRGILNAP